MNEQTLRRFLDVTRLLARPIDLRTTLDQVVGVALEILSADRGTVFLHDEDARELYSTVASRVDEIRFPSNHGIAGKCAQTRRVVNVPNCYADPDFNPEVDRATGYHTRCLIAIPLIGHDDKLVGVMQILNKKDGVFTGQDEETAEALGAQCALALQRARLIEDQIAKQKQQRELEIAWRIQMALLPAEMPQVSGYDLAGWSSPADETGGDIFDAFALDDSRTMIAIADASGHGITAALCVTQFRAMLRVASRLGAGLGSTTKEVNDQLADDLDNERFITAFLGELDSRSHKLAYYAAGQGPLLHYTATDGVIRWLDPTGMPLGVMSGLPLPAPGAIEFETGDIFALITDGIYECPNAEMEEFGDERVGALVERYADGSMDALVEEIRSAVGAFKVDGPQEDDMTIVLLKRTD